MGKIGWIGWRSGCGLGEQFPRYFLGGDDGQTIASEPRGAERAGPTYARLLLIIISIINYY